MYGKWTGSLDYADVVGVGGCRNGNVYGKEADRNVCQHVCYCDVGRCVFDMCVSVCLSTRTCVVLSRFPQCAC